MTALQFGKKYTYTIPAGGEIVIYTTGRYVACMARTGVFEIAVDDSEFSEMDLLTKPTTPLGETFQSVRLRDTSGAPNEVSLHIGAGDFADNRTAIPDGVALQGSAAFETVNDLALAATTATVVANADGNRREVWISNLAANVDNIRVGDDGVAVNQGIEVAPGQTIVIPTKSAVYAWSPSAQSVARGWVDNA